MANVQDKFNAGDVTNGIDTRGGDFSSGYTLGPETKNLTTGINLGQGPRPGMSPIPGHSNLDVPDATKLGGLRFSEETNTVDTFQNRKKFLGLVPLANGEYDDLKIRGNQFIWLVSDNQDDLTTLNAVTSCEYEDATPNEFKYKFDVAYGLSNNLWQQPVYETNPMGNWNSPILSRINRPTEATAFSDTTLQQFLQIPDVFWCSSAQLSVSGAQWSQQWLFGTRINAGTADRTADANFIYENIADLVFFPCGISPSWNLRNFKKNNRALSFWNISQGKQLIRKYVYDRYPVVDSTFVATFNQDGLTPNIDIEGDASGVFEPDRTYVFNPDDVVSVLMNDPDGFCESSYRAVLVAAQNPYGFLIQDWQRDYNGHNIQVCALTDRLHKPMTRQTRNGAGTTWYYEDGVQTTTCFKAWPDFVSSGSLTVWNPASPSASQLVLLNPTAGSGVLRSNTTYEFTFSVFDKQFGTETNVGAPAKIRTGATDFVSVSLYHDLKDGSGDWQQYCASLFSNTPVNATYWESTSTENPDGDYNNGCFNYLEIRFYYRELGTNEWLPALFIDFAKYLEYPDFQVLWACEGNIAGLPGGQPGGFVDYSFLPTDQYDCVVNFRSRAFWLSQKNLVFSLRNNIFAYPLRNSAPAPTGGYKGAIVHTYRGQSEQNSRLVIFGQNETYIGKFTGEPQQMPVVISPDTIASYDVDGSDFSVETWTSITAFSYRSAVVADGDLYFWGPDGIFIDNGVGNPQRISDKIEPLVFNLYDQSLTDEIHALYDNKTKEIIWFYPPASDNTITHAVRYNIETEQFFFDEYEMKIDWAQRVATNNTDVTQKTNAMRTILGVRGDAEQDVQRGVFYDQINRSGDFAPSKELVIKSVAAGSTAREKILTLDSGVNIVALGSMVLGDYIGIQQFQNYTGEATGDDMIAKVLSVDLDDLTMTLNLPVGATLPNVTLTDQRLFFPVWHRAKAGPGLNGIEWTIASKYWAPLGPNYYGIFNYIYMLFKYVPWVKIDPATFTLSYRSPSTNQSSVISDTIPWSNNSDFNAQIMHALRPCNSGLVSGPSGNNQGQALKFTLSGIHIGEEWVLQYLEMQADQVDGNHLKQYQA